MITKGFISLSLSRIHGRLFLLVSVFFVWLISLAWVYPEHREISLIAIYDLDPDRQQVLAELWASARLGYENRLHALSADSTLPYSTIGCFDHFPLIRVRVWFYR